ncbi:MAG: MCE family protein [Nocardioidaceae bacterium]|nr:MCE family protein [Nocardioidaceae bacterium]
MKPLVNRDPFKIGIAAIVVGALVAVGIVAFTFLPIGENTYTAYLQHTAGLRPSEDVEVYGVPVGQVKSLELEGDKVKVRFTVKKSVKLGEETSAEVKVATLLGTHYLAVSPAGGGSLAAIPLSRTTVPYNLQDVLEKGTGNLQKLDPVLLAKALTEVAGTLSATDKNLGPALEGIARLSEAVTARSDQTGRLLGAAQKVTQQLSDSSGDIVVLMRQANLVLAEITKRREAIHTLLTQTTALASNLGGIVADTKADIGPAFRQLNDVLATLNSQDKVLKDLLDKMAPTVRYVANATGNGPWGDLWIEPPAIPPDDLQCKLKGGC